MGGASFRSRSSDFSSVQVRDCFRLPGPKSLAWCFHVESLLLWWARAGGGPVAPAQLGQVEVRSEGKWGEWLEKRARNGRRNGGD